MELEIPGKAADKGGQPGTKKKRRKIKKSTIFVICMLAYPVLHFLVLWVFVNFDSILLTFRRYVDFDSELYHKGWNWVGLQNYQLLFRQILHDKATQSMFLNSLSYLVLNLVVITPLAILAAFFLSKKVFGTKFFRVLFFLPSIMPIAILAIAFIMAVDPLYGSLTSLLKWIGISNPPVWFGKEGNAQISIWVFCVWAGLGYNVILLGSAIGRIPNEIIESGKLEGIGYTAELFRITIPLIWPTLSTLLVMAVMAPFTVLTQPLFLTNGNHNTFTIALRVFHITRGQSSLETAATLGTFVSVIGAAFIIAFRWLMERFYRDVEF